MLRLKDIMQTDVVAVAPELTLRELVEILGEHGVSGAPVVANGKVVGVVSTTDILELEGDRPVASTRRPTSGLEEPEATGRTERTFSPSEFFSDSWEIGALEWMRTGGGREWDILDENTVSDVMTREVLSSPSRTSVREAAAVMLESDVHRLLIIDDGELRGIVTTTDIVRAVARGKLED